MLTRVVFVLLVVLNLGVGAWWLVRRPPPAPQVPAALPGIALLEVAGQSPTPGAPVTGDAPAALPTAHAAPPTQVASVTPVACARLGPFPGNAQAMAARGRLGPDVQARVAAQAGRGRGWRVIVPPLADATQAQAMATRLTQAGFADNFVMRTGSDTNAVALGRFGNEAAARRHAAAVAATGIAAIAEPIGPTQWWLQVGVADAARLDALREATGAASRDALDCAALAAG